MTKNNYNNGQGRQPQQNNKNNQQYSNSPKELGDARMTDTHNEKFMPIFAAYLNMARQNLYDTLYHISEMARLSTKGAKEGAISQMAVVRCLDDSNFPIEIKDYVMRQMLSQFPFIKIMAENERKTYIDGNTKTADITITFNKVYNVICNVADVLSYQRDKHSHVKLIGDRRDKGGDKYEKYIEKEHKVANYLFTLFKAAIRATGERFSTKEGDTKTNSTPKRYTKIFSDGIAIPPIRDKKTDKKNNQDNSDNKPKIPNDNFKYLYAMRQLRQIKVRKEENGIEIIEEKSFFRVTPMGLIMLICQLITKHQASMLFDALGENFYGNAVRKESEPENSPKELIRRTAREIFSFYRIRLAKERIRSERSEYALALDMLNELKKCPDELFKIIREQDQNKFCVPSKLGDNETVLLRRTDDRFPYFALRYIDDMNIFSFMRFHVNYGKYRYVFKEDKQCADGTVQPRVLQYELNGFGRLNEIEQRRVGVFEKLSESDGDSAEDASKSKKTSKVNAEWDGTALIRESSIDEQLDKDSGTMEPYVTDCRTHYIINNNHVGINFFLTKKGKIKCNNFENEHNPDLRCYMPSITDYRIKNADETKNSDAAPQESKGITGVKQPMCRLSVFELPALIFHSLLYKDQTFSAEGDIDSKEFKISATEKVIFDYVSNYRKLFQDIADGSIHPSKGEISVDDKGRLNDDELLQLYGLHRKDIPEKILTYLSGCKKQRNKLEWDKILEKYGLVKIDIPEKLRDKLVSPNLLEFEEYAIIKIAKQLIDAQRKIERIQKDKEAIIVDKSKNNKDRIKNRIGKKCFKEIKAGQLATQLSKDIVSLQGKATDDQNRPTGLNYRKMQAMIAQFGSTNGPTWDDLCKLFNNLDIIGKESKIKHPFLHDVLNRKPSNTIELYEMYYARKKSYLKVITPDKLYSLPFLHADQYRWKERNDEYYKELAKHYLDNTIDLPTGLFDDAIKDKLEEIANSNEQLRMAIDQTKYKYKDKNEAKDIDEVICNVTYLIGKYHECVNSDGVQEMYAYARNYLIYDIITSPKQMVINPAHPTFIKPKNKSFKEIREKIESHIKGFTITEIKDQGRKYATPKIHNPSAEEREEEKKRCRKQLNIYSDNERTLRRYQVQDILSFMMAKNILTIKKGSKDEKTQNYDKFKLRDIASNDSENSILDEQVPFKITLLLEDGTTLTVSQSDLKMKNYGDFYMVLSDSRIKSLIPYIESVQIDSDGNQHISISREDLQYELDAYDRKRVKAIAELQKIERDVIATLSNEEKMATFEVGDDKKEFYVLNNFNELLEKHSDLNDDYRNRLVDIRNSFFHNHYTDKKTVPLKKEPIISMITNQISTNDSKQNQAKNKS